MIKVTASAAISRLGMRFGERKKRAEEEGGSPAMTSVDEENVIDFSRLVSSAMQILEIENQAIIDGDTRKRVCGGSLTQVSPA